MFDIFRGALKKMHWQQLHTTRNMLLFCAAAPARALGAAWMNKPAFIGFYYL
jgi:hypothetical protein